MLGMEVQGSPALDGASDLNFFQPQLWQRSSVYSYMLQQGS